MKKTTKKIKTAKKYSLNITRRVVILLIVALISFGLIPVVSQSNAQEVASTAPNIVMIMTDDQRLDDLWVMPKTKSLIGDKGATFSNFYTDYSLCCPSRATMLSGQLAKNHGVVSNVAPNGGHGKFNHANSLAVWLSSQGYKTSHIGKYMNGTNTKRPQGWTNWQNVTGVASSMYNWKLNDNGVIKSYGTGAANYQTDVLSKLAVNYINANSNGTKPFYMQVWPSAPHGQPNDKPPLPAPRHVGTLANITLPMPPSFNEADVSDKPSTIQQLPLMTSTDIAYLKKYYQARAESLLAVDDMVGNIVNALTAKGVLNNTYIVFTSDNGWMQGEHRIPKSKIRAYEEANQIPLLMRGPNIPAGFTTSRLTSNIDWAPTVVDWANITARRTMDGVSLQNFIDNPEYGKKRVLFRETGPYTPTDTLYFYGVRTETAAYFKWQNDGFVELYDMVQDPYQLTSLHNNPDYDTQEAYLAGLMNQMKNCTGASCFVTESITQ